MRRIEGILLAPMRDQRGVYRFDSADVEGLVRDLQRGDISIWQVLNDSVESNQSHRAWTSKLRELKSARDAASAETLRRLRETADQLTKLESEHRELLSLTQQLAKAFTTSVSTKELDALPDAVLATLIALCDD